MVVKWTFSDLSQATPTSVTWEINPNEGSLPEYQKNITTQTTSAPGGRVILMEGRDEPRQGSLSGVSITESQHLMFIEWFEKGNQIRMTDDLGREFDIVITGYAPTRRWSATHPYRHDYTLDYIMIDWS